MCKTMYEVILSSKKTGNYRTERIYTNSLDKAREKAFKKFDRDYYIHDIHKGDTNGRKIL